MAPRLRLLALLLLASLAVAPRAGGDEPEDRSTLTSAARAFHAAVESGELARIARFGCTTKGPFTPDEVREAGKSVFASLPKMRGRAWEFGPEVHISDLPGGKRLAVRTSPSSALTLTGLPFDGRWCFLSVDELDPSAFTPRDPPLVDPAPALTAAPAVDPEVERAVKEVLATMRRVPAAGDDASSWLLWRRYGMRDLPRELVGDLWDFVPLLRLDPPDPLSVTVLGSGGAAPRRHAVVRVGLKGRTWAAVLLESDGFKVVRVDAEPDSEPRLRSVRTQGGAFLGREANVDQVLTAIDANDAPAFAALSVNLGATPLATPAADAVKSQVEALHGKYGQRPRKVGPRKPETFKGREGFAVPVLFGDAEDLLWLGFVVVEDAARLAVISEGDPAEFPPGPAPAPAK